MAYHEVVQNETRRGARYVVCVAVLIYCVAALLGLAHYVQKYVPVHAMAPAHLIFRHGLNASATPGNASMCPAGHFCAYPFGNQSHVIDCTANPWTRGPYGNRVPMDPCYSFATEVVAYAFGTPVLSFLFPLLPAALGLLCQAWGNGAGEVMLQRREVAVKALQRVATYAVFMIVFHCFYFVKAGLEHEFSPDFDASDTVAVFMLATTVAWREYAHVGKSRGKDCTTGVVFVACIVQLVSSMYIIYQTCKYFHKPGESIGGMIEGLLVCYFFFYVTTADSGVFMGFAGTRNAPFNSPGLFSMPKRTPLIPKRDDGRQKNGATAAKDGQTLDL